MSDLWVRMECTDFLPFTTGSYINFVLWSDNWTECECWTLPLRAMQSPKTASRNLARDMDSLSKYFSKPIHLLQEQCILFDSLKQHIHPNSPARTILYALKRNLDDTELLQVCLWLLRMSDLRVNVGTQIVCVTWTSSFKFVIEEEKQADEI